MRKTRVHHSGRSNVWKFKLSRSNFDIPLHHPKHSFAEEKLKELHFANYSTPEARPLRKKIQGRPLWSVSPEKHASIPGSNSAKQVPRNALSEELRLKLANKHNLRDLFLRWDKRGSGVLTSADFQRLLRDFGLNSSPEEVNALISEVSSTGLVNFQEFRRLLRDEPNKNPSFAMSSVTLLENPLVTRVQREVKGVLANNWEGLYPLFLKKDPCKTGKVGFPQFQQILTAFNLPYHSITPNNYKLLYEEFGGNDEGIEYRSFIENIQPWKKSADPSQATSQVSEKSEERPVVRGRLSVARGEYLTNKAKRLTALIRRQMRSHEAIVNELTTNFGESLTPSQLFTYLADKVKTSTELFGKSELRSFVQMMGFTPDDRVAAARIANFVFNKPPTSTSLPPIRSGQKVQGEAKTQLLDLFNDKFFSKGGMSAPKLFQKFDRDNDGFITKEDLGPVLRQYNIPFNEHELEHLMNFLDPQCKGYASLEEFNRSVGHLDSLKTLNTSQPSTEFLTNSKTSFAQSDEFYQDLREKLLAPYKVVTLVPATRYGHTPLPPDTFSNMQPIHESSLFINESSRFQPKNRQPMTFAHEDKSREDKLQKSKEAYLQRVQKEVSAKALKTEEDSLQRDASKLSTKVARQDEYFKVKVMQRIGFRQPQYKV